MLVIVGAIIGIIFFVIDNNKKVCMIIACGVLGVYVLSV